MLSCNGSGRRTLASLLLFLTGCATQSPASLPELPDRGDSRSEAKGTPASHVLSLTKPTLIEPRISPQISPEKMFMMRTWRARQERLDRISAPLLMNNAALCKRHAHQLPGFTAKTKYSFSKAFIGEASSALGLDEQLRIMSVMPESGAALAGLQQGDILRAVENTEIEPGVDAERSGILLIRKKTAGRTHLNLTIVRGQIRTVVRVALIPACNMLIGLGNSDEANSYADGSRVLVTTGMLNFVESDEELAYILAKEIAHNVLTRSVRTDMKMLIDRLTPLKSRPELNAQTVKLRPYTPVLDATADKIALYLLVRSGYDIAGAALFWKRLAEKFPATMENSYTALHPATSYRLSVIGQITKTIALKQKNNLPLIP
jgi:hypothetical protein